jgi:biopolymer transport protein ExbD
LFFVVTGTIVYQHDRSILPPTSFLLTPGKAPADAVYVDAEGGLSFRGEPQDAAGIARVLGAERQGEDGAVPRTIQVVADRSLNARVLLGVVRTLRDQGLHSLSIVTVRDQRR